MATKWEDEKERDSNRINSWDGSETWEIWRWDEEEQGSDGNETSYSGGSVKKNIWEQYYDRELDKRQR